MGDQTADREVEKGIWVVNNPMVEGEQHVIYEFPIMKCNDEEDKITNINFVSLNFCGITSEAPNTFLF